MGRAFRDFLLKQNALALAVGVIIGAAIGKVVASVVADLIMPLVSLILPSGEWRAARMVLSESVGSDGKPVVNAINYGTFVGTVIDFVIVAFAVFMIVRVRPEAGAGRADQSVPVLHGDGTEGGEEVQGVYVGHAYDALASSKYEAEASCHTPLVPHVNERLSCLVPGSRRSSPAAPVPRASRCGRGSPRRSPAGALHRARAR